MVVIYFSQVAAGVYMVTLALQEIIIFLSLKEQVNVSRRAHVGPNNPN